MRPVLLTLALGTLFTAVVFGQYGSRMVSHGLPITTPAGPPLSIVHAGPVGAQPLGNRYASPGFRSGITPLGPGLQQNHPAPPPSRASRGNCRDCARRTTYFPTFFPIYAAPLVSGENDFQPDAAPSSPDFDQESDDSFSLGVELGRLQQEVVQLKQQQRLAEQPVLPGETAPETQDAPQPQEAPTVLILRNGRRYETHNYAVMGDTFWNFSAHPVMKIPVAQIDVDASQRANAERGVEFPTLEPAK